MALLLILLAATLFLPVVLILAPLLLTLLGTLAGNIKPANVNRNSIALKNGDGRADSDTTIPVGHHDSCGQ